MDNHILSIYKTMQIIRKFEEKALNLFENNLLRGSVHLCTGQEAIPATFCELINPDDYISSTHRGHGHCIAKGADVGKALAELMGKADGYCRGRGGSMHIADMENGNLGANAIVGGGIPIAVGAALASKMQKNGKIAVSFFGDGATNEGTFHEALNLAGVWKLPVVFVCENNGFGMTVPQWQSTAVEDLSLRAVSYNMPGITVDGNDVYALRDAATEAITRARAGDGPTLIECKTYRWLGHWTGDPQVYRTRDEVAMWRDRCPILRLRARLLDQAVAKETLDRIDSEAQALIDNAAEFAKNSPEPDPQSVLDDVFFIERGGGC